MRSEKQGQLKKMSVAIVSSLLLTILLVTAQNISEMQERATDDMEVDIEITGGKTENSEEFEQNFTGVTFNYTEINNSEQKTNGTNESLDNKNEESNITRPDENETTQPERNETILPLAEETTKIEIPQLEIQLIHPDKITRGEYIEVKAIITNFGGVARDVLITWDLPFGFTIISGDKITNCGDFDNGEVCNFSIDVHSSVSTLSGINEIKIKGNYKNETF